MCKYYLLPFSGSEAGSEMSQCISFSRHLLTNIPTQLLDSGCLRRSPESEIYANFIRLFR